MSRAWSDLMQVKFAAFDLRQYLRSVHRTFIPHVEAVEGVTTALSISLICILSFIQDSRLRSPQRCRTQHRLSICPVRNACPQS